MRKRLYVSVPTVNQEWVSKAGTYHDFYHSSVQLVWPDPSGLILNQLSKERVDGVLLFLPHNSWNYRLENLATSQFEEIIKADKNGLPIYIAYVTAAKAPNMYRCILSKEDIGGLAGPVLPVEMLSFQKIKMADKPKVNPVTDFDAEDLIAPLPSGKRKPVKDNVIEPVYQYFIDNLAILAHGHIG